MSMFSCSSCGTVVADGIRVSVGESGGAAVVEIVVRDKDNESVRRVVSLKDLAAVCFPPPLPKRAAEKPRGK